MNREQFQQDEYYRTIIYGNKEPDYWKTCKWCIKYEQDQKDIKEAQAKEEELIEESNRIYRERMRQEEADRIASIEYQTCEICEYRTSNPDAYDRHMESKEHRVKQNHLDWFCKCCNILSRSHNEHDFHLKTTKHQQNAGLISNEPTKYICECCEYETLRKDYYKLHMTSKKHLNNSSK
jgi:hypothetical protein